MLPLYERLLAKEAHFTLAEAKEYVAEVLKSESLHDNKRFSKRFLEEFWPLTAIALSVGDWRTRIIYRGNGGRVDAEILIGNQSPQPVEFTIAFDGEQEALRDEHFRTYGHAPLTAILPRPSKTRASGMREMPEVYPDFWSRTDQQDSTFDRMKAALENKRNSALSRGEYRNAWLGIVVDNNRLTNSKQPFFDPIVARLLASAHDHAPFSRVFVASTVGDYVFDSTTLTSRTLPLFL